MKQIAIITLVLISYYSKAQGISENLSRIEYYQNILEYTITTNSLEYYNKPSNNGYIGQNYSEDKKLITSEYKLLDMDKLMVVSNTYNKNITKIIFVISPDINNSNVTFNTDKKIVEYLNSIAQPIENKKKWKSNSLLFEHLINPDGIGILVVSYY